MDDTDYGIEMARIIICVVMGSVLLFSTVGAVLMTFRGDYYQSLFTILPITLNSWGILRAYRFYRDRQPEALDNE